MIDSELLRNYADLAKDNHRLAQQYANLAARCLQSDEDRKNEIDKLRAEIVILHGAIADLRETIRLIRTPLSRSLPNLDDIEIVTEHGTRRSPVSYEEWETHREAKTWKGLKTGLSKIVVFVIGGVLLAVTMAVIIVLLGDWRHQRWIEEHPNRTEARP